MAYLDNLTSIASQLGISLWLLIIILIWSLIWKLLALWKSARNNHVVWFIILAVINTIGILEILYIYVFANLGKKAKTPTGKSIKRKLRKKKGK